MSQTFTRRAALAGALPTLATVSLPALAALPSLPETAHHPDARLLDLGRRMMAAWAHEIAVIRSDQSEDITLKASDATCRIVDQILTIKAATLDGLKVKAYVLHWFNYGYGWPLDRGTMSIEDRVA